MAETDYTIDPKDGESWGKGKYPPKGFHAVQITDVSPHQNFKKDDIVWDIEMDALHVGGTLTDKAGRSKAASALLAAGFDGGSAVGPDDLIGKYLVVEFGDQTGATGSRLYRSVLAYHPEDYDQTPSSEIDWSPPPKSENGTTEKASKPKAAAGKSGASKPKAGDKPPPPPPS